MTVKEQVLANGTPKVVEVFVGGVYAPEYEMRTEHVSAMAQAFAKAAQK